MKPFIIDAFRDGKCVLEYQIENSTGLPLNESLVNSAICAVSVPVKQSLEQAWILRLTFDNGATADFSSASTNVGRWRELGSLNIRLFYGHNDETASVSFAHHEVSGFKIKQVDRLVYEEPGLYVENGIILISEEGREIWIAAGVSPGSVSMQASGYFVTKFNPELRVQDCRRIPMA